MVIVDTERSPELSLTEILALRARRASDARLIVDAVVGFVVAVAALLAQSPGWALFASAGICYMSYGAWGIADREIPDRDPASRSGRALVLARYLSAIVGFAAAFMIVVIALGIAIGRVIS